MNQRLDQLDGLLEARRRRRLGGERDAAGLEGGVTENALDPGADFFHRGRRVEG